MHEPAQLSRRALAAVLPIAALAGATPVAAIADQTTPLADTDLLALGDRWTLALQHLRASQDRYDEEVTWQSRDQRTQRREAYDAEETALYDDLCEVERLITATPARTLAGMAVKARVLAREHDYSQGIELADLERALADLGVPDKAGLSLAADILRLAR